MYGLILGLIAAAFAIWAMIGISKSALSNNKKVLWFAIVILIPLVGPITYWIAEKTS